MEVIEVAQNPDDNKVDPAAQAVASAAAAQAPAAGTGLTGHRFELGESFSSPEAAHLHVAHCLRPVVTALGRLPGGLSDTELRDRVVERYSRHLPLHRTMVVLVSNNGDADFELIC